MSKSFQVVESPTHLEFPFLASHSKPFYHQMTYTACLPHLGNQTARTSNRRAALLSLLNSDLAVSYIIYKDKYQNYERKHHSGNSCGDAA